MGLTISLRSDSASSSRSWSVLCMRRISAACLSRSASSSASFSAVCSARRSASRPRTRFSSEYVRIDSL